MITLDFTQIELKHLVTHSIGNKLREENIELGDTETNISNETLNYLLKYFLLSFKKDEFYCFTHAVNIGMNEIYSIANNMFKRENKFFENSKSIAKLLYEYSLHPKIKGGKLNIAYFNNIILDDKNVEAIGLFKSEDNVPFIKINNNKSIFSIKHDFGFELKGLDKGCLIFNSDKENGYKVLILDNTNRPYDAQYWKNDFLKVKALNDDYHQTKDFLDLTKNYINGQLVEDFNINRTNQINIMNRSIEYFKTHKNFDKIEFEKDVLQSPEIIKSFREYDNYFQEENDYKLNNNFEISSNAVKKQSKIFRSVLKLDKNFHVYIHGDLDMIEQGIEEDGRKFYKIYFEHES